jgi:hypothetical protein
MKIKCIIQKNFEYHRPDQIVERASDSNYELAYQDSDLVKVLQYATEQGFRVEDILSTHREENRGHITLEHEAKIGYGRIQKEEKTFKFYIPITTVKEEAT